jgi:hypothetical protein
LIPTNSAVVEIYKAAQTDRSVGGDVDSKQENNRGS